MFLGVFGPLHSFFNHGGLINWSVTKWMGLLIEVLQKSYIFKCISEVLWSDFKLQKLCILKCVYYMYVIFIRIITCESLYRIYICVFVLFPSLLIFIWTHRKCHNKLFLESPIEIKFLFTACMARLFFRYCLWWQKKGSGQLLLLILFSHPPTFGWW